MQSVLERAASQARDLLGAARRVTCICHRNPDGDAIGSLLGMGLLLEQQFPNIPVSFHCVDPVPEMLSFLPSSPRVQLPPVHAPGDVTIFLDCAEQKLTKLTESHPHLFDGTVPSVNIDHHPDNPRFGTVNIVIPEASSTCEIVTSLADLLAWPIDDDIATCLLTGVYTDTGGLLHSNTTVDVYRTVARLLRAGACHQLIVTSIFRTASMSTLKLWGRVLEKISITKEGAAISAVTEGDFRATGADYAELAGAIDYVNAVPGMRFSLILSERDGMVKGSLRTLRDDVDVSRMAGQFSGGGHRKAAGFAVSGHLQPEVRWNVVEDTKD
jgi:phosphoesterase RecJ-like protein